jgi:hypothetical protein
VDEHIRAADQAVILETMKEVLWGGRNQEGLLYISQQTTAQVKDLTAAIRQVVSDVNGVDGMRGDIRDIKKELQRMQKYDERLERIEQNKFNNNEMDALKVKADREHEAIYAQIREVRLEIKEKIDAVNTRIDKREETGPVPGWIYVLVFGIIGAVLTLVEVFMKGHASS